jgi:general secretion pathway protein N
MRVPVGLLGLASVAVALAGVIGVELHQAAVQPSAAVIAPARGQAKPAVVPGAADAAALVGQRVATILARPLFSPDRRPIGASGEAEPGLARLTGIMLTAGGKAAIFAGPSDGQPVVVSEGGHLGRYELAAIDADGVTVIGPDGQRVLHPTFDPKPPAVTPVAQPQPPAPPKPPGGAR